MNRYNRLRIEFLKEKGKFVNEQIKVKYKEQISIILNLQCQIDELTEELFKTIKNNTFKHLTNIFEGRAKIKRRNI